MADQEGPESRRLMVRKAAAVPLCRAPWAFVQGPGPRVTNGPPRGLIFLRQIFPERVPVVLVPAEAEVAVISFRKAGVIEDHTRCRSLVLQFKPDQRVEAR